MANIVSYASITPRLTAQHHYLNFQSNHRSNFCRFRCSGENPASKSTSDRESQPEKCKCMEAPETALELARDGSGAVDRAGVVKSIKEDFERSYFVTGNLTLDAYEEDCEFADPASSFKGLQRFKRNCTNFGSLLKKSNMKLMKWEDFEDKGIGHWRFSCILSFPWRPILSASGYTEYYFDKLSGKVCRHVEHWNVPKMVLLKQILKPSRAFWLKKTGG
ncbi:hypothetical protein M0R45_034284 [Rubus argutus]|uniref:NTF2-like domain-containing protein n=1 Tax=Rubus argutus TaxID=59490 RepID=A0AAW1VPS0_RUBAR